MKAYSQDAVNELQSRSYWAGVVVGFSAAAIGLALIVWLTYPAAVPASQDPRMDKLCHWPSKPGEGMAALVLEDGTKRCFELGRNK